MRITPSLPILILTFKSYAIEFYIVTDAAMCSAAHIFSVCIFTSLPHLIRTCTADAFKYVFVIDVA